MRMDRLVWDNDRVPEPSAPGPPRTQPTDVTPLGHDVFQIDTRMAGYDGITAGYLIRATGHAWWRPAPRRPRRSSVTPWPRWGSAPATWRRSWSRTSTWTTPAVPDIAAMFPAADIVVHHRGARHLADPSRLMAGARAVYGAALDRLFGALAPVPADRIVALEDLGTVDLGGGRRRTATTPPATPSITSA